MPTQIKMDVTQVRRMLGGTQRTLSTRLVPAILGWLQETIMHAFAQQASPEGVAWKPLSPGYAAVKGAKTGRLLARRVGKGGRPGAAVSLNRKNILYLSGDLFRGFATTQAPGIAIDANSVTAFSTLPYAAAHQYGSVNHIPEMRPKKKNGVLAWPGPGGTIFARRVKAHNVIIPARPYLPSPEFAEREAARVVEETLQSAIDQAGGSKTT
jgi:phage gpG-like protein